ncbi:unnamed protein product [Linum tenue]|uniref:RING-type E3 ubiquitin transferase n=1 Tax=Linum tenue TaxID=586396 RepID=A0AAV0HH26_9ROSI|nr:unnamed protein product [Linum tenue]
MADAAANQYWCHMCSRMVNPVMEPEVKCPICESGFVEEVAGGNNNTIIDLTNNNNNSNSNNIDTNYSNNNNDNNGFDVESERAFSLWAPILLGLMDGFGAYRPSLASLPAPPRTNNVATADNEEDHELNHQQRLDREFETLLRRRRTRSTVSFLRLLHDIRARAETTLAQHHHHHLHRHNQENDDDDDDEYGRSSRNNSRNLILVDPFNEGALILHGPPDYSSTRPDHNIAPTPTTTTTVTRSFADYLVGPGLDLLLQHLAENDPNRYGTPPARKEAVNAMPTVTIGENNSQCAVCLEDFELGAEAKEMPCKHKFHEGCIHPWLELHSSCPVCRFQMPTTDDDDGSKMEPNGSNDSGGASFNFGGGEQVGSPNERRHRFPLFPFDASLPFLRSRSGVGNYVPGASSSTSSSSTSTNTNTSVVVPLLGDSSNSHDESRGHEQP